MHSHSGGNWHKLFENHYGNLLNLILNSEVPLLEINLQNKLVHKDTGYSLYIKQTYSKSLLVDQ